MRDERTELGWMLVTYPQDREITRDLDVRSPYFYGESAAHPLSLYSGREVGRGAFRFFERLVVSA
jgi:hypothetical protein